MPFFTAPRSRPIAYDKSPNLRAEQDKINARSNFIKKLASRTVRVLTEQIPILGVIVNPSNKFVFPGVQSVKWSMARDITEQYGLQSFTILPWYTKAISVTIVGKAYLGAWATDITSANGIVNTTLQSKTVIEYIRQEMRDVDTLLSGRNIVGRNTVSGVNNTLLSSLSIGNLGEAGSIRILGFVKSFEVDEDVATPFVQKYSLQYLGVDMDWYLESLADTGQVLDRQQVPSPMRRIANP